MNKNIIIITIFIVAILSIGELYRTDVDADYGFYTVRNVDNPSANFSYVDKILYINVGDTIEWINNANPDEKLTIDGFEIVDENTFGGIFYHILRWNYQKYSYTFNKSGKYRIHIDEYPRLISQTIFVKSSVLITPETKITPEIVKITEVPTPTPISQSQTNSVPKDIPGFEAIFTIFTLLIFARKI